MGVNWGVLWYRVTLRDDIYFTRRYEIYRPSWNDSFLRSFFFISTFQAMYIFATSHHFLDIVWKKIDLFFRGGTTNHVLKKLSDQKMSFTKVVRNFTY